MTLRFEQILADGVAGCSSPLGEDAAPPPISVQELKDADEDCSSICGSLTKGRAPVARSTRPTAPVIFAPASPQVRWRP